MHYIKKEKFKNLVNGIIVRYDWKLQEAACKLIVLPFKWAVTEQILRKRSTSIPRTGTVDWRISFYTFHSIR